MKPVWLAALMMGVVSGCAMKETKIAVDQTPPAVYATIQRELVGAQLEDIAKKKVDGQTVYETNLIRDGYKWEVVIADNGKILSKLQEEAVDPAAGKSNTGVAAGAWRDRFGVNKADLLPVGKNPYITMQPGRVLKLRHGLDTLTVTILPDTQQIDGVTTGVLEERETKNGKLNEISRNFMATDKNTGDVYYFGEDVDNYRDGKIVNHESAWRAGVHGARFGLMIPGKPIPGQAFYQEIAPNVAMDRVEVVSTEETVKTAAGTFEHCVHLRETTPLERDVSHKYYAPGVGLIKDDEFELAEPSGSTPSDASSVPLVAEEGTPLRVALDRRVVIKRVGQQVTAVLADPVFAYDRIVLPAGTRVLGHVERRSSVSNKRRVAAMLSGDFTPLHDILLQFDAVVLADGRILPVRTQVSPGTEQVTLKVAGGDEKKNVVSRAGEEAVQEAKQSVAIVKAPDKMERMKDSGLRALPYHPEFFSKGTVFNARLLSLLDFGSVTPTESAEGATAPAPESVLSARLAAPIDSAHATRGAPVEAVVTRPVFSTTHQLILPAGARLTGQVTFVKRASHFRRNGQLRFLFDTVHVPGRESTSLLAALYSVEASRAERLAVDEEGGTKVTNSATRFIAPTVGALALVGLSQSHVDFDTDGAGPETEYGGPLSGSVAGLVGASITGLLVASLGHPAAVALGVLGVVRSTYAGVIGKGREVAFPADTRIQVQLAPSPSKPARPFDRDRQ